MLFQVCMNLDQSLYLNMLKHKLTTDPGPEVIKLFSCSTQLSTKFQLLIKTKILTNKEISCFKTLRGCINHANKCQNANNAF